jgi:tRNA-dihydrouridine synthase 2
MLAAELTCCLKAARSLINMSRRSASPLAVTREPKRQKVVTLTPEDYKNGVMLAPMVRSSARTPRSTTRLVQLIDLYLVPTRLFALKYGAKLVWGPEIVDKAILHAKRVVDRA